MGLQAAGSARANAHSGLDLIIGGESLLLTCPTPTVWPGVFEDEARAVFPGREFGEADYTARIFGRPTAIERSRRFVCFDTGEFTIV